MRKGTPSWFTSFCAAAIPDWFSLPESSTITSSSRPSIPTSLTADSARSTPR